VLLLVTQVFADGGIQRFNKTLLTACERLPLECDVLSLADSDRTIPRRLPESNTNVRGFGRDKIRFAWAAARAILGGGYDVVIVGHVHMLSMVAGILALRAFSGLKAMLVTHGVEVWTGLKGLRRRSLAALDRILCVSDYTRLMIHQQAPELDGARFALFPNALSESWVARQAASEATALANTGPELPQRFILAVARLMRHDRTKGIVTVIEALSMLEDRELHYVIAGNGDDVDFLRQHAARHNVADRVHFLGTVSDTRLIDLYRRCRAFVLPSGQEGFGIVFLEAMYFGAPVIAAREKGAVDVVQHGSTGLLVGFGDVIALKDAIDRVLLDASLRERLRERAQLTVTGRGEFTFDAFVARLGALLDVPHD